MGHHVVLMGPSTAGKTSLMCRLAELQPGDLDFSIDRTVTTKKRRPGEGDQENIFVDASEFDRLRPDFLFVFQTFSSYEYGITVPTPLDKDEIRLRILTPKLALVFKELVDDPTVLCAVAPYNDDPASVMLNRDPDINPEDLQARVSRFHSDLWDAHAVADLRFQNFPGLDAATERLGLILCEQVAETASIGLPNL